MSAISRSLHSLLVAGLLATVSYAQTATPTPQRATTDQRLVGLPLTAESLRQAAALTSSGSGTPGTIAKWKTADELEDSVIIEDGGNVAIGQPVGSNAKFRVFFKPEDKNAATAIFGTLSTSHEPDGLTTGSAVLGFATNTKGSTHGVKGVSYSNIGIGVLGATVNETGANKGVLGSSLSTEGIGVEGRAGATTGVAIGVRGESSSEEGVGVLGEINVPNGLTFGVKGINSGQNGRGVLGYATDTNGINYGVVGRTDSPNGFAGFFIGRVHVAGFLSKAAGAFKIDHPLDPENKTLAHSFVESPEMMNIYNGIITLGKDGSAEVTLPDWFEALNREFRYQLTTIGSFAPVYVAAKVKGNRFKIAGGQAGMEVSWQLTGVRQDAYAERHRIQVEELKPVAERGFYLHPEAFNQPAAKSVEQAQLRGTNR